MARETLLSRIDIPESCVLRMRGELEPELAAREYERQLGSLRGEERRCLSARLDSSRNGDDGHTASLFPETEALTEKSRTVVANFVPKLEAWRLTFTLPLINQARRVCFLAGCRQARRIDRSDIERRYAVSGRAGSARAGRIDMDSWTGGMISALFRGR